MDESRARDLLAAERARIERALGDLAPQDSGELTTSDQHMADAASDLTEHEIDAGLVEQLRDELAAVQRAEGRLAAGTFGVSIESGTPIPDARLEAYPTAERTVQEQARVERGG